jgi:DNA-binding response OmpR family regulator
MSLESPTILLVEEDEVLSDITSFRLELLGFDVRQQRSAEEALASVWESSPNLIILDLYLPGLDGVEFINRLKMDESTAAIPTLVFSVDSDLDVVSRAHNAGADDYLVIPYDPAVLQEKILRLLSRGVAV